MVERPPGGWRSYTRRATGSIFRALVYAFSRSNLLTYASAIAFQVLIAAVALVLLGVALIDLLSLEKLWTDNVAPFIESRVHFETFLAIDTTVERLSRAGACCSSPLRRCFAIWEVSGAVHAVSGALNEIYECEETRSLVRRYTITLALAVAVIACLVGAVLTSNLIPRVEALPSALGQAIGWLAAIVLMGCAVWLLLRYAPSATRSAGWTNVGSIFVVVAWVVASLLFGFYVQSVADYRTPTGNLIALLTLTAYLYTSSLILLTGAQINELLRRQAKRGRKGLDALTTLDRRGTSASDGASPRGGRRRSRVQPS